MKKNALYNFVFLGFAVLYDGLILILSYVFSTSIVFSISRISVINGSIGIIGYCTFSLDDKPGCAFYGVIYHFRTFYSSDYYCCEHQKFMQYAAVYNGNRFLDYHYSFVCFNTAANVCNIPVCAEGGDYIWHRSCTFLYSNGSGNDHYVQKGVYKMNSAENRIAELEKRISELERRIEKLENMLKSIELSGDGQNISFNQTPLYAVKISGDGANANFINSPVNYAVTADNDELEDLEDTADELDCRIEDIKCAALDAKAILEEVQAHFDKLSTEIESLKAESEE